MRASEHLIGGRFEVIRRLGAGGMASVLLAEDRVLGRRVAIKRLHPGSSADVTRRFRREMRIAAGMAHPGIVRLFDAIVDDDDVLLVMEYVDGETLAQRLRGGPLAPEQALAILRPIADALSHIHAQGVVHRDVKPANILLASDGTAKLADLGLARAANRSGLTTTSAGIGTPAYLAPELFAGSDPTPAADVWSLAAVAHEALTGRRVRHGTTPAALALEAGHEAEVDAGERWSDAGALERALRHGLALAPADRPPTAPAFVAELAAALGALAARDSSAPAPAARRRPRGAAVPAPPARGAPRPGVAPRGAAGTGPRGASRRPRRALAAALAALLAAAGAAVAIVVAGGGAGDERTPSTPARSGSARAGSAGERGPAATGSATAGANGSAAAGSGASTGSAAADVAGPPPPPPRAGGRGPRAAPATPDGAVRAFYTRAAAHRYAAAWALAAPALRAQLDGYDAFTAQFSSVRSIRFQRLGVAGRSGDAATVAFATTARHTDRVDHCSGTATTATSGSGGDWQVQHITVSCG